MQNNKWQIAILGVVALVALCSILAAAFVYVRQQFNPPVPTGLPTAAVALPSPSRVPATRDPSLTSPPTTTPASTTAAAAGTAAAAATSAATSGGGIVETAAASATLGLPTQEPSSTPQPTATITPSLVPFAATAPGPTRTARPRPTATGQGPATPGPTPTPCFDC